MLQVGISWRRSDHESITKLLSENLRGIGITNLVLEKLQQVYINIKISRDHIAFLTASTNDIPL